MGPPEPDLHHAAQTAGRNGQTESFENPADKLPLDAPMKRMCFVLQVKPDRIEEYKDRHRAVWPEMLAALRETGWTNYSLFLRDDGLLIGYLETQDFDRARSRMARLKVNQQWQREMAAFFLQADGQLPDQTMVSLEEIFHL
jgi:L-rhamnose mutarotase